MTVNRRGEQAVYGVQMKVFMITNTLPLIRTQPIVSQEDGEHTQRETEARAQPYKQTAL